MTERSAALQKRATRQLDRFVDVHPNEIAALLAAFIMFFLLLSAYYIVRPVRDAMGSAVGKEQLQILFSIVFVVMLAAVPAFGFVASRFARRYVLPILYGFFALNLIGFWLALSIYGATGTSAAAFFVWASVFNLFVVSLFWSLMSELWSKDDATRLFGFIAAGGSAGAVAGPLFTQILVQHVDTTDLLLVSAALLGGALIAGLIFRRLRGERTAVQDLPAGGGLLDGASKLIESPYLMRVALYVFLANVVGTFFYLEQSRLVAETIADSADRVRFFSGRDLIVSIATVLIQIFGTAQVMRRLGLTVALGALPASAAAGIMALAVEPTLWVVAAVMVVERVIAFALANPAMKVMFTLAGDDEKYKVQNFVDTVVYRGGDAASGWLFAAISRGAGFATLATPLVAFPLAAVWLWNAVRLGESYKSKSAAAGASNAAIAASL